MKYLLSRGFSVYYIFIPHSHGNGLVTSGVNSQYTHDYLVDSQIYDGFMDIRMQG